MLELADAIEIRVGAILPDSGELPWSFDVGGVDDAGAAFEFSVWAHSLAACIDLRNGLILRIAALPERRVRQ